jgi:hypothetical protein
MLSGCAIAALPVASQITAWSAIAAGAGAAATASVTLIGDCQKEGGCQLVKKMLPP